ncbi:late histone H2B.L4-like [Leptopilina boulardi]|uniref:late histone H2B.L4-like n=1 Tax=Leptopilina boulardi TaxID=63433 RepID=UPI0021F51120|nr:late histone H2B.L4-like [Leptopilina boulardi]
MPKTKKGKRVEEMESSREEAAAMSTQSESEPNSSSEEEEEEEDGDDEEEETEATPIVQKSKKMKGTLTAKKMSPVKNNKKKVTSVSISHKKSHATSHSSNLRKKKKSIVSYSIYIHKVLKQVHQDSTISVKAMNIMNDFMVDIFERLATEAGSLCKKIKSKTIGSREMQTAVQFILPGELAKHAMSEGNKALQSYKNSC